MSSDINTGPNSDDTVLFDTPASLFDDHEIWWEWRCLRLMTYLQLLCRHFQSKYQTRPFGGKRARKCRLYGAEAGAESRQLSSANVQRSENSVFYWAVWTLLFPINASNFVLHVLVTKREFPRFQQWLKSQGKQGWMKRTRSRTWAAETLTAD